MKKILRIWLGICWHPTWNGLGIFNDENGKRYLVEQCVTCKKPEFHVIPVAEKT